jgi:hypothetical protein
MALVASHSHAKTELGSLSAFPLLLLVLGETRLTKKPDVAQRMEMFVTQRKMMALETPYLSSAKTTTGD